MKSNSNFTFSDIADSKEIAELYKILSDFTGVPMGLSNPEITGGRLLCSPSKFSPICRAIRSTKEGQDRCHATDAFHIKQAIREKKGSHYVCHAGLVDFVVPITIQGKTYGVMNCGQIFSAPPSEDGFCMLQQQLAGLDIDEEELREAYYQTPHMPQNKIESLLKLLSFFAEYFCEVGTRLNQFQKDYKYPEISKAKDFIKQHFREPISLKMVADHVYLSDSYLSRLFHRVEGVTFSQYMQQIRIEETKKLLDKTDWSVSRIAFSVGFGSLSYFNQFFKRIEGCSPSQYRRRDMLEVRG